MLGLALPFLIGPFFIVIAAALSAGETLAFPPQGLSLKLGVEVFEIESFRASFVMSMFLAAFGTLAGLAPGLPAAYGLNRDKVPGAEAVRTVVSAPIIVPGFIVGLTLLRYLAVPTGAGIGPALRLAHTELILPHAVRVASASLENLRTHIEEAAVLLGCTRVGAFRRVVRPNIRGGVPAAFILGFVTSFKQAPLSLLPSGSGVRTLPVDMIAYLEINYDPSVAALSALLAFMSVAIVFAAGKSLGFSKYV